MAQAPQGKKKKINGGLLAVLLSVGLLLGGAVMIVGFGFLFQLTSSREPV